MLNASEGVDLSGALALPGGVVGELIVIYSCVGSEGFDLRAQDEIGCSNLYAVCVSSGQSTLIVRIDWLLVD